MLIGHGDWDYRVKMRVFAISIPRFRKRYAYLSEHLHNYFGDEFEIVGVDGRTITNDAAAAIGLSPAQIGCSLSHIAAYRRIVELDLPCALIVEDDCLLPHDIHTLLAQLEKTIRPGEAIQLYNWSSQLSEFSTRNVVHVGGYGLYYPMQMSGVGSTAAYIITRQAAEKLIRVNDPVKVSADNWSFFQSHGAVSVVRILHPSPVRIMPFESTIFASSNQMIAAWIKRNALVQFLLSIRRRALFRKRDKNVILVDQKSAYSPEPSRSEP